MSRTDERRAALRFCLIALGWLACLFAWGSVLTFDVADAPATTVWPHPNPVHNRCGPVGAWFAYQSFKYLGIAAYPAVFLVTAALVAWSKGLRLADLWLRFLGLAMICTVCSAAASLMLGPSERYLITGPGGVLGTATAELLWVHLERLGTTLLLTLALIVGLVLAADNLLLAVFRWLSWAHERGGPVLVRGGAVVASGVSNLSDRLANGATGKGAPAKATPPPAPAVRPRAAPPELEREEADDPDPTEDGQERDVALAAPRAVPSPPPVKEMARPPAARPPASRPTPPAPADDDYERPPLSLLERAIPIDKAAVEALCREKAYILEQTLNEFRLEVQVVAIETGPVITVFELKLAPGIKVSQIASLANDMARALKAPAVRVVAPLPGKNTIGLEVPNIDKEKVRLRDVIELSGQRADHLAIPLFLGKDAAGQPLVADLTRMPHLLIAGTTGSGKSVCIGSIIMSLLMTRTPAEINMILVDPKVVELAAYKDVPHLMCPIVTEVSKAEAILDWASTKMDERYALLAEAGVKDIRSYNRLGYDELRSRLRPASEQEMAQIPVYLPYIVIIIDELADLMMSSAKEVEFYLCRIAQKSRAVGIHLIVSTQRPQATVVTGLIKSNLPCRIAFRVASRLDSRIVLDQNGGEVLMGQGDMLYLPPGSSKLIRAQGTFIDDEELRRVVKHAAAQAPQAFHPELIRMPGQEGTAAGERDELFDQAVDIILETHRGSVSLLQRRLNVGYSRASRLVEQMYAGGIVGEYKGSQAREVLVTRDEWEAMKNQRDQEESAEEAELPSE